MKLMKVFDCQDMPDQVWESFFDIFCNNAGNDCYVDYTVGVPTCEADTLSCRETALTDWLVSQGATPLEHVLIRHWW